VIILVHQHVVEQIKQKKLKTKSKKKLTKRYISLTIQYNKLLQFAMNRDSNFATQLTAMTLAVSTAT